MKSALLSLTPQEGFYLLMLSLLWGGSFFFIGIAVKGLPPLTIVALRVALAAIALLTVIFIKNEKMPSLPGLWRPFLLLALLNNVIPFCLIVWGQTHIASGIAAILNATTPLFTVVTAHFLTTDEKMTTPKIVGVITGICGVTVMIGHSIVTDIAETAPILAQTAILGAAMSYSFAGIYGKRFAKMKISSLVTAAGQVCASSIVLVPLALFIDNPLSLPMPSIEVWLAIGSLALFSTALAYLLYFRILSTAGATNVLLVTLLIPVSATILGCAFLGEQLLLQHVIGMMLIGSGLVAIDGRLFSCIKKYLASVTKRYRRC